MQSRSLMSTGWIYSQRLLFYQPKKSHTLSHVACSYFSLLWEILTAFLICLVRHDFIYDPWHFIVNILKWKFISQILIYILVSFWSPWIFTLLQMVFYIPLLNWCFTKHAPSELSIKSFLSSDLPQCVWVSHISKCPCKYFSLHIPHWSKKGGLTSSFYPLR